MTTSPGTLARPSLAKTLIRVWCLDATAACRSCRVCVWYAPGKHTEIGDPDTHEGIVAASARPCPGIENFMQSGDYGLRH